MNDPRIVCAANRIVFDDESELIVPGARHWDNIMHNIMLLVDKPRVYEEQGFIDQFGNFYTREQAWVIAEHNNQIIRTVGNNSKRLYSENLY